MFHGKIINMIKKTIIYICNKIYQIGYFAELTRLDKLNKDNLTKSCIIGDDVWLSEQADIINNSLPKENIIIGSRSRLMGQLFLFDVGGFIKIGEDCFIGPNTKIWSAIKIIIGDRVLIAHNVNIHDNISHPLNAQERFEENKNFVRTGLHQDVDIKPQEIIIEDDVWIGFNSTIMKGVKIGRGAIIGANSVVTKDVEAWTVNVGNPLRVVRKLDPIDF